MKTTQVATSVALCAIAAFASAAEPVRDEPYDSGWAFYIDNDVGAPRNADRDYAGGSASMTSGGRTSI
jgi:hypothetical protein